MSAIEGHNFTAAEYLSIDRHSNEKHEFAFGEIREMTGARVNHVVIVGNIASELSNQLRRRPHHVFMSALRLCVSPDRCYTYPDVVVVCDKPQLMDDQFDTLLNPNLIVEVLSESTRNYDRGDKFQQYRGIASFREYLFVHQDKVHVERYS